MADDLELGVVGLGRMGGGLALQALNKGMRVVGFDTGGIPGRLANAGIVAASCYGDFREKLAQPRKVLFYVPAGPVVDRVLADLAPTLEPGDILMDGGNSYWGDSIRRHQRLQQRKLDFVDEGTSGGIEGAEHGACFMVGGEAGPLAQVAPLLRRLAVEGGYVHAGPPGAGHFVKLVHNGIELGMLQAIAEGVDMLEHYHEQLPLTDVLECWRHGSVIRSWLVDLLASAYRQQGTLQDVPPYVEDTGEVNWLVADALEMERPVPVIAQAVMQLVTSRDASKDWAWAIAAMRHGFGGHPYGPDANLRRERRDGRVGRVWRPDEAEELTARRAAVRTFGPPMELRRRRTGPLPGRISADLPHPYGNCGAGGLDRFPGASVRTFGPPTEMRCAVQHPCRGHARTGPSPPGRGMRGAWLRVDPCRSIPEVDFGEGRQITESPRGRFWRKSRDSSAPLGALRAGFPPLANRDCPSWDRGAPHLQPLRFYASGDGAFRPRLTPSCPAEPIAAGAKLSEAFKHSQTEPLARSAA